METFHLNPLTSLDKEKQSFQFLRSARLENQLTFSVSKNNYRNIKFYRWDRDTYFLEQCIFKDTFFKKINQLGKLKMHAEKKSLLFF